MCGCSFQVIQVPSERIPYKSKVILLKKPDP